GVHVAHPGHHGVGLVVQVQAIRDQLFELDLRRPFKRTPSARTATCISSLPTPIVTSFVVARRAATVVPALAAIVATRTRRTVLPPLLGLRSWRVLLGGLRLGRLLSRRRCLRLRCCCFGLRFVHTDSPSPRPAWRAVLLRGQPRPF